MYHLRITVVHSKLKNVQYCSFKVVGKGEGRFYTATGYVPAAHEPDALYYAKSPSKNIVIIYLHIFFNLSVVISFLPFYTTSIFVHSTFRLSVTRKFRILTLVWFRKYNQPFLCVKFHTHFEPILLCTFRFAFL